MENTNFVRGVNYKKLSEKYISLPFLLCLSPLVFLFLGVIISRSPNRRPELIGKLALCFYLHLRYNSRTETWIMVDHDFMNASFLLNGTEMSLTTDFNGDVFPVSDCCNRTGDPRTGCIYSSSSYFRTYLPFSQENEQISIGDGSNSTYLTDTISFTYHEELSRVNLHCTSTEDCEDLCSERKGIWEEDRDICNITHFLSNVCYRLRFNGTHYSLDTSDFVSSIDVGCFASSSWSPYLYSPDFNASFVPIDVHSTLFFINHRSDLMSIPSSPLLSSQRDAQTCIYNTLNTQPALDSHMRTSSTWRVCLSSFSSSFSL